MRPPRNQKLLLEPARDAEANRRRHGRLRIEDVTCSMGSVVDMSASGIRVLRKGRLNAHEGDALSLTLKYGQFVLPVDVTVRRIERVGFRRYVLGMEFDEPNPVIQGKIADLARITAEQRVLVVQTG